MAAALVDTTARMGGEVQSIEPEKLAMATPVRLSRRQPLRPRVRQHRDRPVLGDRVREWRASYGSQGYLREANEEALRRRSETLLTNIWWAAEDGRPGAVEELWRTTLLERLSHTAEELTQRGSPTDLPDTLESIVQVASAAYTPVNALGGPSSP